MAELGRAQSQHAASPSVENEWTSLVTTLEHCTIEIDLRVPQVFFVDV
jgi:hypothetical protein